VLTGSATIREADDGEDGEINEIFLSWGKAFLPYAPPAQTDEDVGRWAGRVLFPRVRSSRLLLFCGIHPPTLGQTLMV
jgi:hypothetical protein